MLQAQKEIIAEIDRLQRELNIKLMTSSLHDPAVFELTAKIDALCVKYYIKWLVWKSS